MQLSRLFLISIFLWVVVSVPSYSTLYYVSPEGNNNNNGRTPQTAWRNVSYATQQVGNDPLDPDTVLVFPGLYDRRAGETFPVLVHSYTALAGLDSGVVLRENRTSQAVVAVVHETAFCLENLEITNGVIGLFVRRCSDFCIYNNRVHHNWLRGVKIQGSKRFTIMGNSVTYNTGGGLEIDNGERIAISGNTFECNSRMVQGKRNLEMIGAGIFILDSKAVRIKGNIVRGNELRSYSYSSNVCQGGGIAIVDSDSIALVGNSINENDVDAFMFPEGGTAHCYGGGVYITGSSAVKLKGNEIVANRLDATAELIDSQGGGIYVGWSKVIIERNRIEQNILRSGGEVYHAIGGGGVFLSTRTKAILQNNIITNNNSYGTGGGICVYRHGQIVIGGEPGGGNDIYGNHAYRHGDDLGCLKCGDTLTATFNYFNGRPELAKIYPPERWDTRFWRHNSILENEPPHILSYFPAYAETTLTVGDSLLFWIESLDYDGDSTFTWWLLNRQPVGQGDNFLFIAEPQHVGYDTVQVKVTDRRSVASHEWYLEVIGERSASPEKLSSLPKTFALQGNYPNPFNLSTVIEYQLPVDCHVRLEVYDLLGRKVATLVDGEQQAGYRSFTWEDSKVSSGVYLYRLTTGNFSQVKKMMLVK